MDFFFLNKQLKTKSIGGFLKRKKKEIINFFTELGWQKGVVLDITSSEAQL